MNCPNCQTEMVLSPNVLLSNPPKYQYECPNCCQPPIIVDYPEIKFKFIPKDSPDLEKLRHLF